MLERLWFELVAEQQMIQVPSNAVLIGCKLLQSFLHALKRDWFPYEIDTESGCLILWSAARRTVELKCNLVVGIDR